jgi:hypothetical protein
MDVQVVPAVALALTLASLLLTLVLRYRAQGIAASVDRRVSRIVPPEQPPTERQRHEAQGPVFELKRLTYWRGARMVRATWRIKGGPWCMGVDVSVRSSQSEPEVSIGRWSRRSMIRARPFGRFTITLHDVDGATVGAEHRPNESFLGVELEIVDRKDPRRNRYRYEPIWTGFPETAPLLCKQAVLDFRRDR